MSLDRRLQQRGRLRRRALHQRHQLQPGRRAPSECTDATPAPSWRRRPSTTTASVPTTASAPRSARRSSRLPRWPRRTLCAAWTDCVAGQSVATEGSRRATCARAMFPPSPSGSAAPKGRSEARHPLRCTRRRLRGGGSAHARLGSSDRARTWCNSCGRAHVRSLRTEAPAYLRAHDARIAVRLGIESVAEESTSRARGTLSAALRRP